VVNAVDLEGGRMNRIAALMLLPFSLCGCVVASEKPNFDTRLIASPAPVVSRRAVAPPAPLATPKPCADGDVTALVGRNACIFRVKSSIDAAYLTYRLRIASEIGITSEALDVGSTASSAAGTATTGVAAKALAALATTLTGTRTAFNNDALYQQSLQAIFKQMEADRSNVWANIQISMQADVTTYTMDRADNDLLSYFRAGTIEEAINTLDANAGTAATTCKAAANAVSAAATANSINAGSKRPRVAQVQPPAASTSSAQPGAASTTEQCNQILQSAKTALGPLVPKPDAVASEEHIISNNIKSITADKKSQLDAVANALGVAVSADYATERGAVLDALRAIDDPGKLADAASRLQTATGQDFTK